LKKYISLYKYFSAHFKNLEINWEEGISSSV